MKWEQYGPVNDWCECRVVTNPELALLMKGIVFQLPDDPNPLPDDNIWDRWVDAASPNCPSFLQSMIPALTDKGLVYAFKNVHRPINLASIVRGCAYKGYCKNWRWRPFRTCVNVANLSELIPAGLVKKWVGEGREFRRSLGPARAAHFAPALQTS